MNFSEPPTPPNGEFYHALGEFMFSFSLADAAISRTLLALTTGTDSNAYFLLKGMGLSARLRKLLIAMRGKPRMRMYLIMADAFREIIEFRNRLSHWILLIRPELNELHLMDSDGLNAIPLTVEDIRKHSKWVHNFGMDFTLGVRIVGEAHRLEFPHGAILPLVPLEEFPPWWAKYRAKLD